MIFAYIRKNCNSGKLPYRSRTVFQKFAPLIILGLFAVGVFFMIRGMHHATKLADPKAIKVVPVKPVTQP